MNKKPALIIIFIAITISYSFKSNKDIHQDTKPKGKLFIIGGGKRPPELLNRLVKESNLDKGGYIAVLPMASELTESACKSAEEQFNNIGIKNVFCFNFIKGQNPKPSTLDSLKKANLIYIAGGDQNKFMSVILNTPIYDTIWKAYMNGTVIAGTSAGAAVMSELMITGNEKKHKEYDNTFKSIESENIEFAKGLGFIKSAIIDQHFIKRSRYNRLISAVIEHPEKKCIGVDEATAILVKGDTAIVIGENQVVEFNNTSKSKKVENGLLGAKNLILNIYLPGDTFKLVY